MKRHQAFAIGAAMIFSALPLPGTPSHAADPRVTDLVQAGKIRVAVFLPQYNKETHVEVKLKEQRQVKESFPRSAQIRRRLANLAEDEKASANEISIGTCKTVGLRKRCIN